MATDTLRELKGAAKRLGVAWREVCELKDFLVKQESEQREGTDARRRRAWELYLAFAGWSRGCLSFWRCGWDHVRRRIEKTGGDYTAIRRYDEIAASLRTDFPELSEWSTQEIFDWLLQTDYQPWPPRIEFYEEALGTIEAQLQHATASEAPF